MKTSILVVALSLLIGCSVLQTQSPQEALASQLIAYERILNASEDTLPEVVASGDITPEDAIWIGKVINKAQDAIDQAQRLAKEGFSLQAKDKLNLAIEGLRLAKKKASSEQAKQNLGRLIAVITFKRALSD